MAIAVVATAAAFVPFACLGIDPHHDGAMLKPALDVLAGETLFRDTFSMYGIGVPYLQATVFVDRVERKALADELQTTGYGEIFHGTTERLLHGTGGRLLAAGTNARGSSSLVTQPGIAAGIAGGAATVGGP